MNKKLNTVLFVLAATLINLIIMAIFFTICLVLLSLLANPESSFMPLFLGLVFLVSIGGTYYVYTVIVKWISTKFPVEEYLAPLFKRKKSTRPPGGEIK